MKHGEPQQSLTPAEVAQDILQEIDRRVRRLSTEGINDRSYDSAMSVQYLAQAAAQLLEHDRLARLTDVEIAGRLAAQAKESEAAQ